VTLSDHAFTLWPNSDAREYAGLAKRIKIIRRPIINFILHLLISGDDSASFPPHK
jgi:hypothetical protein